MKKIFKLLTIIAVGIFAAAHTLLAAGATFFYFMSLGKLVSDPLNGTLIVALSNEREVADVMPGICVGGQAPGTSRLPNPQVEVADPRRKVGDRSQWDTHLRSGERQSYNGFSMTTFRFRSGA